MVNTVVAWDDAPSGPRTIERKRLETLISEVASRRLTLVVAGAGFGKSTLLRAWAEQSPAVLHTLSDADRSPAVLMRTLFDSLRARVPGLANEPAGVLEASADHEEGAPAHASVLAEALRRSVQRPILIMLDEWETIAASPGSTAVDALIRQAPPQVRIVMAGRSGPSFRLGRMRGQGQILDIGPSQLAFTLDETRELVALRLGDRSELSRRIHELVAGWPAGVRLALEVVAGARPEDREAILEKAGSPGSPLVEYLTEEALDLESEEDRTLLTAMAPLGQFTQDLCVALGFADAPTQLDRLSRRGIYLEATDGRHAVMPLVRAYLDTHGGIERGDIKRYAQLASEHHADRGAWEEALHCARIADATSACIALITDHGAEILAAGHARTLLEAFALIPDELRSPEAERFEAEGLFLLGMWDRAGEIFDRLMVGDDDVEPALAWRAGLIQQLRGDFAGAARRYGRAAEDGPLADRALALGWWAAAAWVVGDVEACRELTSRALQLAHESGDHRALANAHTAAAMVSAIEDDRQANDNHYLKALDHAIAARDVVQQIRIRVNRSSRHLEEGSYHESIEEATIALRLAELTGFVAFQALGLLNRGRSSLRLGRLDEAVSDFEAARRLWDRLGSKQVAYALNRLGDVYRVRGDLALARASYEEARSIASAADDRQGLVPALAGLAQVVVFEEPDAALKLTELAAESGPVLGHAGALLALGWVRFHRGELEEAAQAADRAADVARKRRDRAALGEALELKGSALRSPSLITEAKAVWEEVGDPLAQARVDLVLMEIEGGGVSEAQGLAVTLQRFGARGPATRAMQLADQISAADRPEVEILTLGAFQVIVRGEPVLPSVWQSKKARDLLKLLIARRGRPTHREVLIESLWPEEDHGKTANRLSVTLSTIRGVLDPLGEHGADHFIAADRDTVSLRLDRASSDVERFLEGARAALVDHRSHPSEATRARLKTLEAAYLGDFMEEDPYAEWAVSLREEARQVYLACTRAIASAAAERGDHDDAARYHLRTLERDPFDEDAHLGLVRSMSAAGRHGEALRLYRQYSMRMAELGIEAAPFSAP